MAEIEIGVFLNPGKGPEHQELMPLPGSLVKPRHPNASRFSRIAGAVRCEMRITIVVAC